MYELISYPGLQFYVYRPSGTLKYTLTVAGRSPRDFELHDTDFDSEDADGVVKYEECLSIQGTDASAVGLKLKLVRNNGILDIHFQGRYGSSAHWTFKVLQEAGNKTGMYASASTQTRIANFVIRGKQTTHERLFSAKCDALVRSKGFRITSITCKDADEALWTSSSDGEAKRQLGQFEPSGLFIYFLTSYCIRRWVGRISRHNSKHFDCDSHIFSEAS
jgi:hypothetical protein